MSDEAAFLQVIAATPTDDTTRLVYADWLDEHAEPARAAFLRAECEWARLPVPTTFECRWRDQLPPEDERYPPKLLALSELAQSISSEWLATVSRVGVDARNLADRFVARIPGTHTTPEGLRSEGLTVWAGAITRVREMFQSLVGHEATQSRFLVPVDYLAFSLWVGELACPDEFGMSHFDTLYDPATMASQTIENCKMYAKIHGPGANFSACGLWVFVGYGEKHDFHLCCDRESPLFGCLVDLHDSHPWIEPPHGPSTWEVETRSFLDYLRHQVAKAETDESDL